MAQKEIKSRLEMQDLYFPEYSFKYNKNQGNMNLTTSFNVNYAEKTDDKNQVRIELTTLIKDDRDLFELKLVALAFFKLNPEELSEKEASQILRTNTVAIMFPFVRSQVSLLTTQPGMTPILLQPINIDALVQNIFNEGKSNN